MSTAISVDGIGKRYRIGTRQERADTLFGAALGVVKAPFRSFRDLRKLSTFDDGPADDVVWALRDISFEVKHGEAVGLIGRNGAGKSTLLKVLARIVNPTTGSIDLHGRVASLLEVGTGFHPELTGRENAFLNGAILGMTKAEVDRKFDEIVAFSGVETFIDTPVKRYSSGMKVRLAFAVAAHLEPEILLVDEVLAVGDVAFQRKCLGKMEDVAGEGRTVVFVSHHMSMIQALCKRGVVLDDGQVSFDGGVEDAISAYLRQMEEVGNVNPGQREDRSGNGSAHIHDVWVEDSSGARVVSLASGNEGFIGIDYSSDEFGGHTDVAFGVYDNMGICIFHVSTKYLSPDKDIPPSGVVRCRIPRVPLPAGAYRINVALSRDGQLADHLEHVATFDVTSGDFYGTGKIPKQGKTKVLIDYAWKVGDEVNV